MKILVTGDTGFIGRNLIPKLLEHNHDVVGIHHNLVPYKLDYPSIMSDICNSDIQRVMMRERPDVVYHLAAQTGIMGSDNDVEHNLKSNILGLLNVLEGCKYAGFPKIIFPSSGGTVYGNKLNAKESDPLNPCNPYGITKVAGEWYLRWYYERFDIPYAILRLGNVYGPGNNHNAVSRFINDIKTTQSVTLYNGGTQEKDYIYIDDVISMMLICLNNRNNQILNVGTGKPTQTVSLVSKIAQLTRETVNVLHKSFSSIEVTNYSLDYEKATYMFDWKPLVNIDEGLKKCL